MQILHLVAILCCLATGFAAPTATIKWCVISDPEEQKCNNLAQRSPVFTCVRKDGPAACIVAIKAGEADAITLNGENIYKAGLRNYDLAPIIAEVYHGANPEECSYSVAVAKKTTTFGLNELSGKKSCHSGLGTSEGWILPIGTLLSKNIISWAGPDNQPLQQVVSSFFSASCIPGANGQNYANLCQLCKGGCSTNEYSVDAGAFKCLAEEAGDVAFMNPAEIPPSEKNNYQLLCQDGSRAAVGDYKTCNLGVEPAHAVVTRKDKELADHIWTSLTTVRGIILYSSEGYEGKNLLFTDSAQIQRVPEGTDSFLYLGAQYTSKIRSFLGEQSQAANTNTIRWCAVGHAETAKCDAWNINSLVEDQEYSAIECQRAETVEECFKKLMRREADAVAVDGGQVYTAGKCGLVPVMVEQYDEGRCSSTGGVSASSYYAVAVVKKDSGVKWSNLKGKRSCHTGMGRTAGWNIPMGHIHKQTNNCDFTQFFSSGCAPGAEITSQFCTNCKGSGKTVGDEAKCKPTAEEQYYGYAGAFRCLAEGAGDVAFIKHTIVGENTNGNGPDWASGLQSENFELICPGKDGSVPISGYESCNLAMVPAHAVMTRPDMRREVASILNGQQAKFGRSGSNPSFRMFESTNGKNLLFKDSTKCLQEITTESYETFLGQEYMAAMQSLRQCSDSTPDLEKSCTFQTCQ